mgnify:CR=1 FL=1
MAGMMRAITIRDGKGAADALRADPQTLRYLRLRVADLETRLADLTSNNRDVLDGFIAITREAP